MGFWDSVGKAATALGSGVVDAAKESVEKNRQFKDAYADKSDSELFNLLVTATRRKQIAEGAAIRSILTSRGHSSEQISAKVRALL